MSTELEVRPEENAVRGLALAEEIFTPDRRLAISRFLGIDAEEPALPAYLAICASYGLDPVMGHVWLIPQRAKVKARDGDATEWRDVLRPAVGRDGLLAIARRDPSFLGLRSETVHERDAFEVEYGGGLDDPAVLHRFASKPTQFLDDEDPDRYRGKILGAWAKVRVANRDSVFYFASLREHSRTREDRKTGKQVWDGAWGYTSAMIRKAAQSYVLRIAFGITGVVPVDELAAGLSGSEEEGIVREGAEPEDLDLSFVADDDLREALANALRGAELTGDPWSTSRVTMTLSHLGADQLREAIERIERESEARASSFPDAEPEEVDGEVEPEGDGSEGSD